MDNAKGEMTRGTRRPRQGETFWRERVLAWKASGLGARRFCREQGLAVSTFGLWRRKLSNQETEAGRLLALTPDTAFVVSRTHFEPPSEAPSPTLTASSSSLDRVTLSLAGVHIELSGTHAERIVGFVLGQLGGGGC
jgi:hypothetical protein